ncbi:MAG TPA: O-antigen ligase family protein [Modicisalibacter sp.]|nr:O-antigen ligase family protein [Modicisalibacter sp.]
MRSGWPRTYVDLAVACLGGLALVIPAGYWIAPVMLALGGVAFVRRWPLSQLSARDLALVAVLLLYGLVEWLIGLWHGAGTAAMHRMWPAWLAAIGLMALKVYPPRLAWLWAGLAIGGLATGCLALWQNLTGATRSGGFDPLDSILYGNFSLLTGLFCLAGLGWAWRRMHRALWVIGLFTGALGGLMASALSGTRGGWVALPLVLLVFYRGYLTGIAVRLRVAMLATFLLLVGGLYALPQTGVQARVEQAVRGMELYLAGEETRTSVGARLEMLRGASHLVIERPWLGWGNEGYQPAMRALGEAGVIGSWLGRFWHAHNDVMDAWAKRGLPGLLTLLALYLVPLWLFLPGLRDGDPARRALAVAGVILPVAFISFGLTYSFMAYSSGVVMYTSWLVVLWSAWQGLASKRA